MDLSHLVLRTGAELTVRGAVVSDGSDLGLLLGSTHPVDLPGVVLDQPSLVRIDDVPPGTSRWPNDSARLVELTGKWTGVSIEECRIVDKGAFPSHTHYNLGETPPADLTAVVRELELMRILVGISLETAGSSSSASITATNVRMVQDALGGFFDHLTVRRAPHSSAELAAASRRIREITPAGLLSSFGDSTDRDGIRRSTASVQRVTPDMAVALEDVPATALDLTVLLKPSSAHGG